MPENAVGRFAHGNIMNWVNLFHRRPLKAHTGVEVYLHAFLTIALDEGEWLVSRPGHFIPGDRAPGTH
jgi:hypothetical protein